MKHKRICVAAIVGGLLSASAIITAALVLNGVVLLNNPSSAEYPVRGVDISSHQGDIEWQTLASQNIDFVFMKATEGTTFVDPCFAYNCSEAQKCDIAVGAYHFFRYDSTGLSQAAHFIDTVTPFKGMLPPVIDLEFYGDNKQNPPKRDTVGRELKDMLSALEAHYGLKPIIYATEKSYKLYLSGEYDEYDIWIRNILSKPRLQDGRAWTFWQFTNREKLPGYNGREKFIDVNVFHGSREEFLSYPRYSQSSRKDLDG